MERDNVKLQFTMGKNKDMPARLQDGLRNLHIKEVSRLASPQYQILCLQQWQRKCPFYTFRVVRGKEESLNARGMYTSAF